MKTKIDINKEAITRKMRLLHAHYRQWIWSAGPPQGSGPWRLSPELTREVSMLESRIRPHHLFSDGDYRFARWFCNAINGIIKEVYKEDKIVNLVTNEERDISGGYTNTDDIWKDNDHHIFDYALRTSIDINFDFKNDYKISHAISKKWNWVLETTNSMHVTNMDAWFKMTSESISWAINYLKKSAEIKISLPADLHSASLENQHKAIITAIDVFQSRYDPDVINLRRRSLPNMKKAYIKNFNGR